MRLTLSRKVFLVFSLLTSLGVLMGCTVLLALNNFSSLHEKGGKLSEFRIQAQKIQTLQLETVLKQTSEKEEEMGAILTTMQALASEVDQLLQWHNLDVLGSLESLTNQVDFYRQAFLELSRLYKLENNFLHDNNELLEIIEKRIQNHSQAVQVQLQPVIVTIITLQIKMHGERSGENIRQLKKQENIVKTVIDDPMLGRGIHRLIANIERNYVNYLATENREDFLEETSDNFERISKRTSEAITAEIKRTHQLLGAVIAAFSIIGIMITLVLWRLTASYFREHLAGLGYAVRSIRSGDFDFTLPPITRDELGDQIIFIQEVALNLKEKLSLLAVSEEKFRGLVENISDWTWSIDQHGTCLYSSPKSAAMIGLAPDDVVGRPFKDIIGITGPTPDNAQILRCIEAEKPFDALAHGVARDEGLPFEMETSGRPVIGDDGSFRGFQLISRDISERKRNEESLIKQAMEEQFLNKILALTLAEIDLDELFDRFIALVLDSSWLELESVGVIFLVDKERQTLELKAHRGLDRHLQKMCKNVPFGVCLCGRAAQSGKLVFCNTIDERHEIGHEGMHMHGHYCVPIHSVAGEVIGVFNVYIPAGSRMNPEVESTLATATTILGGIIKRRQAEAQLSELNQELERLVEMRTAQLSNANKELDTFAYSVSHDLRAPLRAIDGFSLALLEDCSNMLDDEGKDYLDRVRSGCQRMEQLIEDILQLSRLTRGEINREPVNLSKMAHEVAEMLQQGDPGRQVEWQIDQDLQLKADSVMVWAVLDNLLGNAWKYSSKTDRAVIQFSRTRKKGKEVFFVKDNGAGFDMHYKEKLFTVFQRLHSTDEFEGNGIGLATVQRIIHRHGGEIWAESEEGKGAVFYFWL